MFLIISSSINARQNSHCNNKKEHENTLELCSNCEGYKHQRCIEKCTVLLLKICRLALSHYEHTTRVIIF